jgi:hypothetical protein
MRRSRHSVAAVSVVVDSRRRPRQGGASQVLRSHTPMGGSRGPAFTRSFTIQILATNS